MTMLIKLLLHSLRLLVLSLLLFTTAQAQVYRYVDENGKVVYTGQKPVNVESVDNVRIRDNSVAAQDQGFVESISREVVIYTAEWCKYCKKAKAYFESRGIYYDEYDIEKDPTANREYKRLGGKALPLILVGSKRMSGFSKKGFQRLYSTTR